MKNSVAALFVGFLLSLGLGVSGMTQPQKVLDFLDVWGDWDPSLLAVMFGAILVHSILYRIIRKRSSPLLSLKWHVPTNKAITPSLVVGGSLFGIGWGMAGICPGPGIVSLASGDARSFAFVGSMLVGMLIFKWVDSRAQFRK